MSVDVGQLSTRGATTWRQRLVRVFDEVDADGASRVLIDRFWQSHAPASDEDAAVLVLPVTMESVGR